MKGISAVLATVLIVVITVAIIGMAYGWATGMFKMTTGSASDATNAEIDKMQKRVEIVAATCSSDGFGDVTFSIKGAGNKEILATELTAFVDETLVDPQPTFTALATGATEEYVMVSAVSSGTGTHTLKVVAPAGSVEEEVICS